MASPLEKETSQLQDSNLPNPWLANPTPTSQQYWGLESKLKKFISHKPVLHIDGETWPYRSALRGRIYFFEFRGFGPPPVDVGLPGDIYIDLTFDSESGRLLYVFKTEWVCCNWSPDPTMSLFPVQKHPLLANRYLWAGSKRGFTWVKDRLLDKNNISPFARINIGDLITASLESTKSPPGPASTAEDSMRSDSEIARRKKERERWTNQIHCMDRNSQNIQEPCGSGKTTEEGPQINRDHGLVNSIPSTPPTDPPIPQSKKRDHPDVPVSYISQPTKRVKILCQNSESEEDDSDGEETMNYQASSDTTKPIHLYQVKIDDKWLVQREMSDHGKKRNESDNIEIGCTSVEPNTIIKKLKLQLTQMEQRHAAELKEITAQLSQGKGRVISCFYFAMWL